MQLNADLVVLSACETGFGKFEQGNGTASLARAFMYAGVPALVVSLWEVNDGSTNILMQFFYKNLSAGMDKAEALRQAKLEYIGDAKGTAAHPAFWAAFIQLGDNRPIPTLHSTTTYFWFDLFSNAQHDTSTKEFTWWTDCFAKSIQTIGYTLLVLEWHNPIPLTRMWCGWELACSCYFTNTTIHTIMDAIHISIHTIHIIIHSLHIIVHAFHIIILKLIGAFF
jgi:hypothetical protein